MRVLLVDDNEELREFITLNLVESQIEVVEADTADDAFAKFESGKFDVLIIDSVLEKSDGIALTQRIRATRNGRNVPILLMSTLSTSLMRRMAKDAGCNEFLAKPFGTTQLLEHVRALGRS